MRAISGERVLAVRPDAPGWREYHQDPKAKEKILQHFKQVGHNQRMTMEDKERLVELLDQLIEDGELIVFDEKTSVLSEVNTGACMNGPAVQITVADEDGDDPFEEPRSHLNN